MTTQSWADIAAHTAPRPEWGPLITALWAESRGDWEQAHSLAQEVADRDGAWVHAYLHRREGDTENAAYWYRQAGKPVASGDLDQERQQIAQALLA